VLAWPKPFECSATELEKIAASNGKCEAAASRGSAMNKAVWLESAISRALEEGVPFLQ
jgi:hypothetical protein